MPFKSKAQEQYMFANHPDVAKRFAAETPPNAKLPDHVAPKEAMTSDRKFQAMQALVDKQK